MPARLPSPSVFAALAERLIPGVVDAGFDTYVGRQVELGVDTGMLTDGLADLEAEVAARHGGRSFEALRDDEADAVLAAVESGALSATWTVEPRRWFTAVSLFVAGAYYGDPGNGGNRDEVGWREIGYPSDRVPAAVEHRLPATVAWTEVEPRYDVIVVGAGAGGGIVADTLSAAGHTVLVVERGPLRHPLDLRGDHLRNQRLSIYGHNGGPDDGHPRVVVSGDGRERVVEPHRAGYQNNAAIVGGGTAIYGAQAWRFFPDDFAMASRYGVPDGSSLADWPIDYADLEPYYDSVEWDLGVAGADTHPAHGPRRRGFPMPAFRPNAVAQRLIAGADALEWSTGPVPLLVNTEPFDGRAACVRCSACVGFGCPSDAKSGTHNTVLPRAVATGRCHLLVDTAVASVDVDESGRAAGVSLVRAVAGTVERRTIRAPVVVLSAGAVESARLLVLSGLGNAHDQVGRNLQGHTYVGAWGRFAEPVQDGLGPGPDVAVCDFAHGNEGIVGGGMLSSEFVPMPLWIWLFGLPPGTPRWGAAGKAAMGDLYTRCVQVMGPIEEVPNPDARVTLAGSVVDRFGLPVARITGSPHPEDRRTATFLRDRAVEWMTAAGATQVWPMPLPAEGVVNAGQHQAGTCRMGTDPRTSVTGPDGALHGHKGVFVADASLHPTNGGVNPVLTILANARRIASGIAGAG